MTNKLILKLTLQSIKSRKRIIFPYIVASILLFSMEFVMFSLIGNEYVQTRHETLPILMTIAAVLCTVFTVIFVLYAGAFSQKSQYKELGLYSVLGLEKKHVKRMITYEMLINFFIVAPFSIILGYLFGIVSFKFINTLMKDTGATIMQYPFSTMSAYMVLIISIVTYVLSRLIVGIKLRKTTIRGLFESAKNSEREPKSRVVLGILGLILLVVGYYISLTTKDPINGIRNLFIAVLLVMIATYFLFVSLSIIVLKRLKASKRYYLKPNNFLSTSGMLYRMKSNAISLAGISVLCTGLIITIGTTTAVYFSLNNNISTVISEQYLINGISESDIDNVVKDINDNMSIESKKIQKKIMVPAIYEHQEFTFLEKPTGNDSDALSNIVFLIIEPLSSYNSYQDKKIELKPGEILLGTNIKDFNYHKPQIVNNKDVTVKNEIDSYKELFRFAVNGFYIVANDTQAEEMRTFFKVYDRKEKVYVYQDFTYELQLSLENNSKENEERLNNILRNYDLTYQTADSIKRAYYSINGGFLSLGIMLSIVMLIGTALMLYYKQISEGYADKEKFSIMKKVGLEDNLIKKTIKKQVLWIFFLPIGVAVIHTVFAFSLLSKLLIIFGMRNSMELMKIYGFVSLACFMIYGMFYKFTSKVYYNVVR